MDINSALSREIFRPLAITVCPGALAITPWVAMLILSNEAIPGLVSGYTGAAAFLYIIACIASGLALENIGSHIEYLHWRTVTTSNPSLQSEWNAYLQLQLGNEIVGQRYLREILFRTKFELSTAPALIVLAAGIAAIQMQHAPWTPCSAYTLTALTAATAWWMYREAKQSVVLLSDIRHQILASRKSAAPTESGKAAAQPASTPSNGAQGSPL